MHSYRALGLATTILALCGACSAHDSDERTEEMSAAEISAVLKGVSVPVPGTLKSDNTIDNKWTGRPGELVVADALTACTSEIPPPPPDAGGPGAGSPLQSIYIDDKSLSDSTLRELRVKISDTLKAFTTKGDGSTPPHDSWRALRQDPKLNFIPISNQATAVKFTTEYPKMYNPSVFKSLGSAGTSTLTWMQRALWPPAVNLCMARGLHEQMQLGWNMFLTGEEQRYLLETVRERAQVAMLELGDIAAALKSDDTSDPDLAVTTASLRFFANGGMGPGGEPARDVIAYWAKDLSDAARLVVTATQQLVGGPDKRGGLLLRSASARDVLPDGVLPAADDFRPASWRQRVLALLYGGRPLAASKPGVAAGFMVDPNAPPAGTPWPTAADIPYASSEADKKWTPGAIRFLQAAQENDALTLLLKSTADKYTGPADLDVARSVEWLYRDLEAVLRTKLACLPPPAPPPPAGTTCPILPTASQIPPTLPYSSLSTPDLNKLGGWAVWQSYQLQPEDARSLVSALVATLPSAISGGGFHIVGGTNLVTLPGRNVRSLHFDPNVHILPRSLLEVQSVYGIMGRHRVPEIFQDAPLLELLYHGAGPLGSGGQPIAASLVPDADLAMGVVPALAALRQVVQTVTASTGSGVQAFKDETASLTSLLDAAIGDSQVTLRPAEQTTTALLYFDAGNNLPQRTVAQPTTTNGNGTLNRVWLVRVLAGSTDAFWSDSLSNYSIVALLDADAQQALAAAADPKSTRAGFSSFSALISKPTAVTATALTRDAATGEIAASLTLPEGSTATLVARHRTKTGVEYRAMTGAVKPLAITLKAADGALVPLPADSRYFIMGGDLTSIAAQVTALTPLDPAVPYYDGFGDGRSRMSKPSDMSTAGSLEAIADKALDNSKASASDALSKLSLLIQQVQSTLSDKLDVEQTRERTVAGIKDTLKTLCGAVGDEVNPACDIDFVLVNAMGPTSDEMVALNCDPTGAPDSRIPPNWPAPTTTCPPVDANDQTNAVACALAAQKASFAFKVEVARPVACAAWQRTPSFAQGGNLASLLLAQHTAYWAYRDNVAVLDAVGQALVSTADTADKQRTLAKTQLDNENNRVSLAKRLALDTLGQTSQRVADAQSKLNDAANTLSSLTGVDVKKFLLVTGGSLVAVAAGTGAAIGIGAASGAAVGSVAPGIGTAIGAAIGALVGVGIALADHSREEQIEGAQNAVNEFARQLGQLQLEEKDLASYYGVCKSGGTPLPGQPQKWGPCPDPSKLAPGLFQLYDGEKLAIEQSGTVQMAQALTSIAQVKTQLTEKLSIVWSSASNMGASSLNLHNAMLTARLDIQRKELEQRLVVERKRQDFAVEQFFYSNRAAAAQDQMEFARRQLRDARHVMEYVYAANFTTLTTSFGTPAGPPSTWVDQIYDYDLLPLAASSRPSGSAVGFDPDKITNYVANMATLRNEYENVLKVKPYTQNSALDTIIAGPAGVKAASGVEGTEVTIPDPKASQWQLSCPQGSMCAPNGGWCSTPSVQVSANGEVVEPSFAHVCDPPPGSPLQLRPGKARVQFYLDRWGNVAGTPPASSLLSLFDGRWGDIAVNIVSRNTVRGCPRTDPTCAFRSSQIGFRMFHLGPYMPTGVNGLLQLVPYFDTSVQGVSADMGQVIKVGMPGSPGGLGDVTFQHELFSVPLGGLYELWLDSQTLSGVPVDLGLVQYIQLISKNTVYFTPR